MQTCDLARSQKALLAAVIASMVLSAPSLAVAQEISGVAVPIYEPHADGDRFTVVPDAAVVGDRRLVFDFATDASFLTRSASDATDDGLSLTLGAGLSLTLFNRVLGEVELPAAAGTSTGFSFADVRTGARVTVYGSAEEPLALGIGSSVWIPTGSEADQRSDGEARLDIRGIGSGRAGPVLFTGNVGYYARKKANAGDITVGPSIVFGAGAAFAVLDGALELGPEIYGLSALPLSGLDVSISRSTPVEALVAARYHTGPLLFGATLGGGLTPSPGTSTVRLGISVGSDLELLPDRDDDGVLDDADRCPDQPGLATSDPRTHGCPDRDADRIADPVDACVDVPGVSDPRPARHGCPPDRDDDTFIDAVDACRDVPGVASEDPTRHGCPPDRDADTILDPVDACPDEPGAARDDPAEHGCPDRDGDAIVDPRDACPDVAGIAHADPAKHGCPSDDLDADGFGDAIDACPDVPGIAHADPAKHGCPLAQLCGPNATEICIHEPVLFAFGSSEILPASAALLAQVAQILRDNPDIEILTVDGHTDARGLPEYNRALSEQRAAAVRTWLIDKEGVAPERLVSHGYGKDHPIAPNDNEDNRAKNRRVELHVLRRNGVDLPAPHRGGRRPD